MYSPKTHNFAYSQNTLYTAESAQFYSAFSPISISLTPRFRGKRGVWLRFFAENAHNDPKTHSYEDSAKFNSAFSATTLIHASRFRRKRRVIENFEYLGEIEEYFRKCCLYCVLYLLVTERCKKKFKNRLWKSRGCVPLRHQYLFQGLHLQKGSRKNTQTPLHIPTNRVINESMLKTSKHTWYPTFVQQSPYQDPIGQVERRRLAVPVGL